jgi:hypothetical protein
MLRRGLLLSAGLIAAVAVVPAAATAAPRSAHVSKHVKKHVVAVKRGHHVVWLNKRDHRLVLRFAKAGGARRPAFLRSGFRPATVAPAPTITVNYAGPINDGSCGPSGDDAQNYTLNYGAGFGSQSYNCVSPNGPTGSDTNAVYPGDCNSDYPSSNGYYGFYLTAQFIDGEQEELCNTPDENPSGNSNATYQPVSVYLQGFKCQATVGVNADGQTPLNMKTPDSIEVDQAYTDPNGNSVSSISTVCAGQLPKTVTPPTSTVTHEVGCSEYNPYVTGKTVRSIGESATFPDGQYTEECNLPNYPLATS